METQVDQYDDEPDDTDDDSADLSDWDDDADDDNFVANATSATDLLHDVRYMRAVADMGTRLTRILSGNQECTVEPADTGIAPAWQKNNSIYLEPRVIKPMCVNPSDEREVLPMLTGFMLHEYGHLDFTPRPDNATWTACENDTCDRVAKAYIAAHPTQVNGNYYAADEAADYIAQVRHMLNVLEDQRQELLVSTKYPRARSYFRLLMLRSMLKIVTSKGAIPAENYGLYYGRRHIIPASILKALRADFSGKYGEDTTQWLEAQVTDYCTISATTNDALKRMWDIADAVWGRIKANVQSDRPDCMSQGHIGSRVSKREQDSLAKQGKETLDAVDKANAQREAAEKAAKQDKSDASNVQQGDGQGEQEPEEATASSGEAIPQTGTPGDTDKPVDDSGETAKAENVGQSAGGKGRKDGTTDTGDETLSNTPDDLSKALQEEAGDSLRDLIENLLDKSYDKVAKEVGEHSAEIRARIYGVQAQRLARLLGDIATDLAPTTFPRERSGRLDSRRVPALVASAGRDPHVFTRKQEDLRDEATMGVYVLLDHSGSMQHTFQTAQDAAMTLAKAAEIAGHFTKVATFGNGHKTLKDWHQAGTWAAAGGFGGSTNIRPSLDSLWGDFRAVNKTEGFRNNVVFIVTDGDFDDERHAEETFRDLARKGVHIFLIGIGSGNTNYRYYDTQNGDYKDGRYSVEGTLTIQNVAELEGKMRGIMRRLAVNITRDIRRAHL